MIQFNFSSGFIHLLDNESRIFQLSSLLLSPQIMFLFIALLTPDGWMGGLTC